VKFTSTRGGETASLDDALLSGIAGDGGLFIPESLPRFGIDEFDSAASIVEVARVLLTPFFDQSTLAPELDGILSETFCFPIPLVELPVVAGRAHLLELFHGPTAAFKDVGAGFLASCLGRLQKSADKPLTILVATSGDTGGAVAAAFDGRTGIRVVVLFPEGRVSARQARQLTCWGGNVLALAVQGSFDDCQALVKAVLADKSLNKRYRFTSANSINIGRLLPQCTYYAHSSLARYRETGRMPSYIVPTGNLGNALALMLTRQMGLPIGEVVLATNANRVIPDFLRDGRWAPGPSIPTLASAMDVGDPSNMERLRVSFGEAVELRGMMRAVSVSDEQIEQQIREDYSRYGFATCPHTATASVVYRQMDDHERRAQDWIVVATAHPAKFEQTVEPLIGGPVPLPESLRAILERPSRYHSIAPDLGAFEGMLHHGFHLDVATAAGDK